MCVAQYYQWHTTGMTIRWWSEKPVGCLSTWKPSYVYCRILQCLEQEVAWCTRKPYFRVR
jgi:hypothetical protein